MSDGLYVPRACPGSGPMRRRNFDPSEFEADARALAGMDIVRRLQPDDTPATAIHPREIFRTIRACR